MYHIKFLSEKAKEKDLCLASSCNKAKSYSSPSDPLVRLFFCSNISVQSQLSNCECVCFVCALSVSWFSHTSKLISIPRLLHLTPVTSL